MNSYLYYFRNKKAKKFQLGGVTVPTAMPAPDIKAAMQRTYEEGKRRQKEYGEELVEEQAKVERASALAQRYGVDEKYIGEGKGQMNAKGAAAVGVLSDVGIKALDTLDNGLMGDKNFGAQSAAIDQAVNGASDALIKSGNPYAMCCLEDTVVFTNEGKPVLIQNLKKEDGILGYLNKQIIAQPIEELFPPLLKPAVQIETEGGIILRCSIDHPVYSAPEGRARYFTVGKKKQRRIKEFAFKEAGKLKVGDFVAEAGEIPFFGNHHEKFAYLIGLLIGDGTYGKGKAPRLFTGDPCTWTWLEDNNLGQISAHYFPGDRYTKEFREYSFKGLQGLLKEIGIYGQTKKNKRLPKNLHKWDKESCAALLAGLFDTDGFVNSNDKQHAGIALSQSNLVLIKEVKLLLLKFGIHSTISESKPKDKYIKNRIAHTGVNWILNIKTRESVINFFNNIQFNINYKQKGLQKAYLLKLDTKARDTSLEFHNVHADKIKRIISLGLCKVYNLRAGISHTYLADGIVTHNTAGIALKGANFLTKAGGQTTEGYDVNINNSGYGNLGHQDASSSRDFATAIGLGGLSAAKQDAKLARRNTQAQMALKAANISDDIKFEQEARMNSVDDVLRQNQIALAGGLDSSLLAAKKGGKLNTKNLVTAKRVHPKEVIDEKGNKIKVPKKLSDAQQRGAQPFAYNGKHYYLNGDGKTCVSLKNTVKQNKEAVHGFCRGGRVIYEAPVYQPVKILEAPPLQEDVWGEILKAQNGARLQQIEVSEESNVLPSGELHKNKHDDFGIDVTKKGIPVITVADDSVETLQEIQDQADTVVQHAEVEKEEVIFNKELTDFVESMRAKWHDSNEKDEDCLLQVGMRVAKEMIENTDDNANLMNKLDTK